MIVKEDRQGAIALVDEAVSKGACQYKACEILEIDAHQAALEENASMLLIHCGSTSSLSGEPNASK